MLATALGIAPAGVDVWCGKAYRPTNSSFDPGGWLETPALASSPMLVLSVRPRMSLYLPSDSYASFIVDASLSLITGDAYVNSTYDKNTNLTNAFTTLFIEIRMTETGLELVGNRNVSINSTSSEFVFSLAQLTPQLTPYNISITGSSSDGVHFYTATTQLHYLPARTDGGSVTKIDSLYGSLLVQDYINDSTDWTPLFPYTYYVSWDGFLADSLSTLTTFKDQGYNIIHIVPDEALSNEAFPFDEFSFYLDKMDELGLWLMYDMRWTYKNLSSVQSQVESINSRKSMLLWYTGDEPDGQTDALNATKVTYDLIKSIDPYHPVSLCLNCLNYHYEEYSAGADIILSDVYPIGNNNSFSHQYGTVCNTTYGCCGCDDCDGTFEDISDRLDLFTHYQEVLGLPPKTFWGVPQAFGNDTFWDRYPSVGEEVVMNMLSINHGAKGIVMWDYPSEPTLQNVTSSLSKILTAAPISNFFTSATPIMTLPVTGQPRVDVTAWVLDSKMLLSIVNLGYIDSSSNVSITLPKDVSGMDKAFWGASDWTVAGDMIWKLGISGLEVDLVTFDLK